MLEGVIGAEEKEEARMYKLSGKLGKAKLNLDKLIQTVQNTL